jgi:hypothetical protein
MWHEDQVGMKKIKITQYQDQTGMFKSPFQSDIPTKTHYENTFEV